jgi:hypothetical protein
VKFSEVDAMEKVLVVERVSEAVQGS